MKLEMLLLHIHFDKLLGRFMNIRLDATPEHPPLEMHERYTHKANYPTTLAYLKIFLNDREVTSDVPSAYMLLLLNHLLVGVDKLLTGHDVIAKWFSDPWQLEIHPILSRNRLLLTLQLSEQWVAFKNVEVSLDRFVEEVLMLAKNWRRYLHEIYLDEIRHPEKGEQFRRFEQHLKSAEFAWKRYREMYS